MYNNVDETLFGGQNQHQAPRLGPMGYRAGESAVISTRDVDKLKEVIVVGAPEASQLKEERLELRQKSKDRVKNWGNTLEALRRKKEMRRLEKLEELEAERRKIDAEEALIQAEQRKQAIERANKMLYDDTDRVKSFHSRLLLSDVMKEREAQIDYAGRREQFLKQQDAAWARMEKEQIKVAELEEEKKQEEIKRKAMDVTKMQLEQLDLVKQRVRQERLEAQREGELIKKRAEEDLKLEKAAEEARRQRARDINAETMRLNQELQKLREQEKKREAQEEERIKKFAEEKERMLADRRAREEERFKQKQAIRQRMIDAQVKNLSDMKANEQTRLDKQVAEAEAKSAEAARAAEEKRQKDLEAIDRSRQFQLKLKSDLAAAQAAEEIEFQKQWKERYKQIQNEEAEEVKRVWLRNKNVQNYIKKQAEEKRRKSEYERRMELAESEQAKMLINEEDLMFQEYAHACIAEWKAQNKPIKPMLLELRKKEKMVSA